MKKLSFISILFFSVFAFGQSTYKNTDFEISYDKDWICMDKYDVVILYHTKENITMNIVWSIGNKMNDVSSKINTKTAHKDNLRIKDAFDYEIIDHKETIAVSYQYLKESDIQVTFTAKIPKGYVDFDLISLINKIPNSLTSSSTTSLTKL